MTGAETSHASLWQRGARIADEACENLLSLLTPFAADAAGDVKSDLLYLRSRLKFAARIADPVIAPSYTDLEARLSPDRPALDLLQPALGRLEGLIHDLDLSSEKGFRVVVERRGEAAIRDLLVQLLRESSGPQAPPNRLFSFLRGPTRSPTMADLEQVSQSLDAGVPEILLLGHGTSDHLQFWDFILYRDPADDLPVWVVVVRRLNSPPDASRTYQRVLSFDRGGPGSMGGPRTVDLHSRPRH